MAAPIPAKSYSPLCKQLVVKKHYSLYLALIMPYSRW